MEILLIDTKQNHLRHCQVHKHVISMTKDGKDVVSVFKVEIEVGTEFNGGVKNKINKEKLDQLRWHITALNASNASNMLYQKKHGTHYCIAFLITKTATIVMSSHKCEGKYCFYCKLQNHTQEECFKRIRIKKPCKTNRAMPIGPGCI